MPLLSLVDLLDRADRVLRCAGARLAVVLGGRRCAGCGAEGSSLCGACRALLARPARTAHLRPRPAGLPDVHAVAAYEGPVREVVVAFKDHGRWALRSELGPALARSVAAAVLATGSPPTGPGVEPGPPVALVPVPGSPGSSRARDGDHVRELARAAARDLRRQGLTVTVVPALVGVRRRRDQVGLGRAQRAANLRGSMSPTRAARRLAGHHVVLVDDVVTSGASLAEAARALASAGVRPAAAAVVATTRLRQGAVGTSR